MPILRSVSFYSCFFVLSAVFAGCGDDASKDDNTNPGGAITGVTKAFDAMTSDEQRQYMVSTVMPTMKELFSAFDADEFGNMRCTACHGTNAAEVGFEMPNGLRPLGSDDMPGAQAAGTEKARVVDFMATTVVPRMAELLGQPVYDSQTRVGFGCFSCHAREQ